MNKDHSYSLLLSLDTCIFYLIFFINTSSGADYQYEACVPKNCGIGPNISFPFYIQGRQESYCGYPGFALNCGEEGHPVLPLPQNDDFMVVENISYQNQSLLVYNAAVFRSNSSSCLPRIGNTTLPTAKLRYVDFQGLYLFSNCTEPLPEVLIRYQVACNNWTLALSDRDENLRIASENCEINVFAPGEGYGDGDNGNLVELLRRGFWLEWTASDCSECETSGGRCGFNETDYQFRCFCPDRPHSRSCKPGKLFLLFLDECSLLAGDVSSLHKFDTEFTHVKKFKWGERRAFILQYRTSLDNISDKIYPYLDHSELIKMVHVDFEI